MLAIVDSPDSSANSDSFGTDDNGASVNHGLNTATMSHLLGGHTLQCLALAILRVKPRLSKFDRSESARNIDGLDIRDELGLLSADATVVFAGIGLHYCLCLRLLALIKAMGSPNRSHSVV